MAIEKKYFPIKTDTACRQKWAWSTLFLNSGLTASCHRASTSELTEENFLNFHNTDRKLADRQLMLAGKWPGHGCEYCRDVENEGGHSDRMFQLSIPDVYPLELAHDQTLTKIDPVILEVFFKNTCNLACVYCKATLSSRIEGEDNKFGSPLSLFAEDFESSAAKKDQYENLTPLFWQWLDQGYKKLKRISVLGGEPFIQEDFHKLVDYIENNANPELEFLIISNLIIKKEILVDFVIRIKKLLIGKKLKRIEILASVDCWGPEQEYIRYGFNCDKFEENFKFLLDQNFISLGLQSTVTSLSIPSMPKLAKKIIEWNDKREIQWYTGLVIPDGDHILSPYFLKYDIFKDALDETVNYLSKLNEKHYQTTQMFLGIANKLKSINKKNIGKQQKLIIYLNEIDRRRNLNWKKTFPWLAENLKDVV